MGWKREHAETVLRRARRFLEQDEATMANYGGTTRHGRGINWVYTPRAQCGRGYATALVAELSERALPAGKSFPFLFTDLESPVSNAIYKKIGYEPVCDMLTFGL